MNEESPELAKLNSQPGTVEAGLGGGARNYNPNRFCLHFEKESNAEIERRKYLAKTTPLTPVPKV